MRRLRVCMLGGRGVPACYSGYDTLLEQLAPRLARRDDMDVTVYCRASWYKTRPAEYRGVHLVYLPAPRVKGLESLLHSFLSALHVLVRGADVVYFVDPANAPFVALLRLCGMRVVVHTDGLGWKRRKWGAVARAYYKLVERISAWCATDLVTDNEVMREYYQGTYGASSALIAYGAENESGEDEGILEDLGISKSKYLLVVARLEPDNNTDLLLREYGTTRTDMPLVVVGDAPYSVAYHDRLVALADARVVFAGRVNHQPRLNSLYANAYVYLHAHEVGGTNPSLLRAMGFGTAPVVLDCAFNVATIGGAGFVFGREQGQLRTLLHRLVQEPCEVARMGREARQRAETVYRWDIVDREHYELFSAVCRDGR